MVVKQRFFVFTPIWGKDPIWRAYFSDGLVQPPTRIGIIGLSRQGFWPEISGNVYVILKNSGSPKNPTADWCPEVILFSVVIAMVLLAYEAGKTADGLNGWWSSTVLGDFKPIGIEFMKRIDRIFNRFVRNTRFWKGMDPNDWREVY